MRGVLARRDLQGAPRRRKPGAPLSRPGSGRGARHPCGGSRPPGLAAAKVSRSSGGRPSFPGPGPGDNPLARTVSEGSAAPSAARPRASIAPNSDSQLGRRRGPAHARLPRPLLLLPALGSRIRAERAPSPAPGAWTGLPVRRSAHADAGRLPGTPSPEGQLSAGRRAVGPAGRCPGQRQVWELH